MLEEDKSSGLVDENYVNGREEKIRQKEVLLEQLLEEEQILNEQGIFEGTGMYDSSFRR